MQQVQAKKQVSVQPDTIVKGVRMFNPTKPHGTVYSDGSAGSTDARYAQEFDGREVLYRGDGTPIEPKKP